MPKVVHRIYNVHRLEIQILERFEKENGGELLAATLCLLEVSSRGLLETELLAILGDDCNIVSAGKSKDDTSEKSKYLN